MRIADMARIGTLEVERRWTGDRMHCLLVDGAPGSELGRRFALAGAVLLSFGAAAWLAFAWTLPVPIAYALTVPGIAMFVAVARMASVAFAPMGGVATTVVLSPVELALVVDGAATRIPLVAVRDARVRVEEGLVLELDTSHGAVQVLAGRHRPGDVDQVARLIAQAAAGAREGRAELQAVIAREGPAMARLLDRAGPG